MRRALLLAALAAPALAPAQTVTSGVVENGTAVGAGEPIRDDRYVNIDECNGAVTSNLELLWNVKLVTGKTANGGLYRVFASNREPTTTEPRFCPDDDPTNNVFTKQVGADVSALVNDTTDSTDVAAAEFPAKVGFTCDEGQTDQTIHVCVHYLDSPGNERAGWAVGSLTLSLRRPPAPSGVFAGTGENALEVSWTKAPDPTGSQATATGYRVYVARKDTGAPVGFKDVTTTSVRMAGLENEVTYVVSVFGLSAAMNESADPATAEGTPMPVQDFWEFYRGSGGREVGGCAAGAAGPLALLGVAALLAFRRRRS